MWDAIRRWWTAECGASEILRIAFPLVVSTGFFSLTLFVDRMFLLWHSADAMAASMPSGTLQWALICFPLGLAQYANTFVAQYHGAQKPERIGPAIWQSARVALYAIPLFIAIAPVTELIFRAFNHAPHLVALEATYFRALLLGAPAAVVCGAFSSFFTGRGEMRIVMYVNFISTIVNIVFDYLWIFGRGGFPEMGILGAALATALSHWTQVALFLWLMFRGTNSARYHLWDWRFDRSLFRRMVFFGAPNGLQYLVESSGFTIVMMKLGELGGNAMAATTLAFNVNAVAFIPLVGISIAVSTLVAQQLAQERPDLATRATWSGIAWALTYSVLFGIFYLFFPHLLMAGHAAGASDENFADIQRTATILLRFVAAYCLFDALQIVFVGAIKGAGDTWFVLISSLVVATLAVSIGCIGDAYYDGGLYWWWSVVTGWIFTLGLLFGTRFLQGAWKKMRVIESVPVVD